MASGTVREGSLEAPTRHPLDWKSADFWDEASCRQNWSGPSKSATVVAAASACAAHFPPSSI